MLADSELRGLKEQFWVGYKLWFPAEVQPSDAVVSGVSRELFGRRLCIFDVWKVRSLQFQLGMPHKKRKRWLADGLYTDEPEMDEVTSRDVDTYLQYLQKLHMLMIAYALNGRTLEAVMREVMELRDAHWYVSGRRGAPTLNAKPTAKTMKDGATLCADFQKGTCSPCSNGAHRCAVVLRGPATGDAVLGEQDCGWRVLGQPVARIASVGLRSRCVITQSSGIMVAKVSSARTPTKWFCVQLFVRPSMCRQRCAIYLPMKPTFCWGQTNGREEERIGQTLIIAPCLKPSRCAVWLPGGIAAVVDQLTRFTEAVVGCRLTCTMVYFDDAHVTDLSSAKGEAADDGHLWCFRGGLGFRPSDCGFGFGLGCSPSCDKQKPRTPLPAGTASKLHKILNFLEQGIYGRVGTGGLHALKERQHESSRELTRAIRTAFETVRAILRLKPRREVEILPSPSFGSWLRVTSRGVWYIDNVAALMALIRGRSDSPDLERLTERDQRKGAVMQLTTLPLQNHSTRMQTQSERRSNWATALSMYKEDGLKAFYKGLLPCLLLSVNASIQDTIYDTIKNAWLRRTNRKNAGAGSIRIGLTAGQAFWLGLGSKLIASTVCYPLTRVKQMCQAQTKRSKHRQECQKGDVAAAPLNMFEMAMKVYRADGLRGFVYGIEGQVFNARLQQEARLGREFVGPDPERMREDETKGSPPSPRKNPAAVWDPDTSKMYIFGGDEGVALNDLHCYDSGDNSWQELLPSGAVPSKRSAHAAVWDPNEKKIYVFGGGDGTVTMNDLHSYNSQSNTWTQLSPSGTPPSARRSMAQTGALVSVECT
ncbi:RABEPK [Symbiodinium microadriaticum]|nr:RABEPK [Symbiodinium microadriaticum]